MRGREARTVAWATRQKKSTKEGSQESVKLTDLPRGVDFYDVLDVDRDASQESIRSAYKSKIRATHPDMDPSAEAAEKFMQVQEAFRWLSDPGQREVYDGIGSKFGQDAIYDYTDEPILGSLDQIQAIEQIQAAVHTVNGCRKTMAFRQEGVKINFNIVDLRARFKNYGNRRIEFVRNYLCQPLRTILTYPKIVAKLHPFERLSIELTLTQHMEKGGASFGKMLSIFKTLRQRISEEACVAQRAVKLAQRGREATFIADQAVEDLHELLISHAPVFHQFIAAQTAISKSPVIDLDKPTVVFVGAPNVGKSSIVRSLSTGVPEVNNYCFTTKQLTVGHLWHFISGTPLLIHGQIVDSPGMRGLWEKEDNRYNLLDQLTLGSMEHLPTGVCFVFDPYPTTHGLLSVTEQLDLRDKLRKKFPKRPWLDVITKCDLLAPEAIEGIATLSRLHPDAIQVSSVDGTGLAELNIAVRLLLEDMTRVVRQLQRTKIRQLRAGSEAYSGFVNKEALSMR